MPKGAASAPSGGHYDLARARSAVSRRKTRPFRSSEVTGTNGGDISTSHLPVKLILNMRADDVVEALLHGETERQRAGGVEPARPAGDDALDQSVGRAANARRHPVAGDPPQR